MGGNPVATLVLFPPIDGKKKGCLVGNRPFDNFCPVLSSRTGLLPSLCKELSTGPTDFGEMDRYHK